MLHVHTGPTALGGGYPGNQLSPSGSASCSACISQRSASASARAGCWYSGPGPLSSCSQSTPASAARPPSHSTRSASAATRTAATSGTASWAANVQVVLGERVMRMNAGLLTNTGSC